MGIPILGSNSASAAYDISNSLRFNDGDSPVLSRTPSSTGNRRTFTISAWVKRCKDDNVDEGIFNAMVEPYDGQNRFVFGITNAGQLNIYNRTGGTTYSLASNDVLRDPSAWYHCVCIIDSTDSTEADRQRMYLNGRRITSFADNSPISSQNAETAVSRNDAKHAVGDKQWTSDHFDGYIAEHYYLDGVAYEPTYFAETNDNGVWVPKEYTGGNFGTNGHFLQFKQTGTGTNSSGMGADTSGNDNHFAVTNLAATDVTADTPTNNFATLNPLTARTHPEIREGNLQQYEHGSANSAGVAATMMPIKGKWYAELFLNGPSDNDYPMIGITDTINLNRQGAQGTKMAAGFEMSGSTNNQGTNNLGSITNTNTGWPNFSDNDIVMYALDCDNRKLWLGRNGTWINSGDPAAGSNEQLSWTVSENVCPFMLGYDNSQSGGGGDESIWNYGNPPFSISSSNADANGYGNFEYAVPSGYYALCTKNLAEYG